MSKNRIEAAMSSLKEKNEKALIPFFTTKPDKERSGMGFTVMEGFMDKMEVFSQINKGTTVVLTKNIKRR